MCKVEIENNIKSVRENMGTEIKAFKNRLDNTAVADKPFVLDRHVDYMDRYQDQLEKLYEELKSEK